MGWGKVSAILFDMDGVLCDSEQLSRMAAVDVFAEMGVSVTADDFVPFMGTGIPLFLPPKVKRLPTISLSSLLMLITLNSNGKKLIIAFSQIQQ